MTEEIWMSTKDVARHLGVSPQTLSSWARNARLPHSCRPFEVVDLYDGPILAYEWPLSVVDRLEKLVKLPRNLDGTWDTAGTDL